MKITYYDKFAFTPKKCSKCNKLFIFEWYNKYEKFITPIVPPLIIIKCKDCICKNNEKG